MSARSEAEEMFAAAWERARPGHGHGPDVPERELVFAAPRRWRFDFAWPSLRLAVEIDGRGRHQSVAGVRADCEKHNRAVALGWRVLHFPATDKKLANEWAAMVLEVMCCTSE